jgi:hypothetical protein
MRPGLYAGVLAIRLLRLPAAPQQPAGGQSSIGECGTVMLYLNLVNPTTFQPREAACVSDPRFLP